MHGQGNYSIQVGQDPYAPPPAFQQHPATTAPSTSNYGSFTPQSQVMQHGPPSFHPRPGAVAYQHAMTSVLHQGRPAPVASGGMSSVQSYVHHPRPPPQINNQNAHWSQNAHQLPPPPPFHGQSAYQFPSPQGHTLERGPSHQYPSHAPPPLLPPYSSTSNVLASDPCGSSVTPMTEQSYRGSMAPMLPPPPPPPLPASPVRVPPLPPSSPSSNILEGNDSWKGLPDDTMELECSPPGKPMDERSDHVNIHFQHTESRDKVGSVDAEAAHSPADSDMDIEDDNTCPDEEKKNCLSVNSNNECGSMSHEDNTRDRLQPLQHTEGPRLSEISVPGDLSFAEGSGAKAKGGGSEVASDCNFPDTIKLISRDKSGTGGHEQNEISFDASFKEMSPEINFRVPVPVVHLLPGYGEPSGQLMEGADSFKILQGYSSNCTSENEDENIGDVSPPSINGETTKSDPEKGNDFGSVLSHKSLSESNKNLLPESVIDNVMQADQFAIPTGLVAEVSDRSHRDQKPISSDTYIEHQSEDSSRKYDESVDLEEAKANKPDMKSDKLKVDEFGRLVREDVSDSDASDSPPHVRRHARRTRKRSRSQSRSRSPHDRRRRRRSPWRRKDRRGRSRSVSPRRRSRSRSPVLRRDTEFSFDKLKREKGCFDFLRGKCYRGASCRYSHHESGKSERSRYNREKHHNRDALPTLLSPDNVEGKVLTEKEMKDEGRENFQDMPDLREANAKRLPVYSTSQSPDKTGNLSGYAAHDTLLGKHNFSIPESASTFSDKIPQVVDLQGKGTDDSLPSEPSSLAQLLAGTPTHHPADRQESTSQLCSVESHLTKPYSNEEVPFWTLHPSIANHSSQLSNHPSQLSNPLPSASQPVSASFDPSILQNYNSNPPTSQYHLTPPNYSTYEAPVAYQHSHFPGPLKSLSSKVLPPPPPLPLPLPPPPPPPPPPSVEHSTASQHMQQSAGPPWNDQYSHTSLRNQKTEIPNRSQTGEYQAYSFVREPDHVLHRTDGYGSSSLHASNLTSREGGPHMMGEGHISGDPIQGMNSSKSFTQSQTNPLLSRSPFKGMHSSLGVGLSSDGNSSHGHPYFQQSSYGLQYSTGDDVHSKLADPGMVSSSASRVPQDFLERNRSYVHGYVGSKISNHFNPYASTFDLPLSSKFSSNTLVREDDIATNTTYGTPVGLSSASVDPHRIQSVGSKNISSSSVLPAECVSRPSGNQYDPLFDSIEQNSNSSSKAAHVKHEITGDSDDIMGFHGSGRLLNTGTIKQKGETAVSANDSSEKEECGETADMAVGDVLNSSPSNPNDAADLDPGEFEIDQVKTSGKKKKSKEKSAKLFKISIAAFVKEVLKPSWRQGNMSKEAFKTIVKKTVDKVSGAMKGHQIPKSQEKVNHYIDSSRGKLTKLVMGYVDKYVKV